MTKEQTSIDEAIRRTSLSSSNQMEMLTFRLTDRQLYGINVFKIIEIVECPKKLAAVPYSHPTIPGVVDFRGEAISVIDISAAIGMQKVDYVNQLGYLVVCEYNRQLNAFLVSQPESLLTRSWDQIKKPTGFDAKALVAIAYSDSDEMVLLLDIEEILSEVVGIGDDPLDKAPSIASSELSDKHVMMLDDSNAAMLLMTNTMKQMGINYTASDSAINALEFIHAHIDSGNLPHFDLIISDIEMPGMDGFTFTRTARQIKKLEQIPIILHSSMSNPTNQLKAKEAGANQFIAKFNYEALSTMVTELLSQ